MKELKLPKRNEITSLISDYKKEKGITALAFEDIFVISRKIAEYLEKKYEFELVGAGCGFGGRDMWFAVPKTKREFFIGLHINSGRIYAFGF